MTNARSIGFWIIGSLCVFFGALIAGSVQPEALGATAESVVLAYIISFILILIGGMFWITVAVIREEEA
ncbi:MAG: hypothetical protein QW751_02220 [Candidatus Aenigmatarchaeota archaeon]